MKASINSTQYLKNPHATIALYIITSPIKENRKNLKQMDSTEILTILNEVKHL